MITCASISRADAPSEAPHTESQLYEKMISDYRTADDQHKAIELIASGSAATLVGVYGYYFDERGVLAQLAYAATQTAGIIVIGEGVKHYYSVSTMNAMDQALNSPSPSPQTIKRAMLENHFQLKRAKQRADAWTAGLLGSLYAYNAIRTPRSLKSLRNVYLFLSINALAVSGYNTYQLWHTANDTELGLSLSSSGASLYARF